MWAQIALEHQGVLQPALSSAHSSHDHWAPALYSGWAWKPAAWRCVICCHYCWGETRTALAALVALVAEHAVATCKGAAFHLRWHSLG